MRTYLPLRSAGRRAPTPTENHTADRVSPTHSKVRRANIDRRQGAIVGHRPHDAEGMAWRERGGATPGA